MGVVKILLIKNYDKTYLKEKIFEKNKQNSVIHITTSLHMIGIIVNVTFLL